MLMQNFKTAAELELSEEEYDAHVRVLHMLERGELVHWTWERNGPKLADVPPGAKWFNMRYSTLEDSCGTVACIGGWVGLVMGLSELQASEYVSDVGEGARARLYYPHWRGGFTEQSRYKITTEEAAQALRNYLTTGEPRWNDAVLE